MGGNRGWTRHDMCDRLKNLDESSLLEVWDISSEDIVDRFNDKIEEKADELEEELRD